MVITALTKGVLPCVAAAAIKCSMTCRNILKRFPEPAALDNTGAFWQAGNTYSIADGAKRFEFYERNYAAQVHLCMPSLGPTAAACPACPACLADLRSCMHALSGCLAWACT